MYAEYQFTNKFALAGRAEYFSDRGALFSGLDQALKETTLTTTYRFADRFMARAEGRYDFSNQPFFLYERVGDSKKEPVHGDARAHLVVRRQAGGMVGLP